MTTIRQIQSSFQAAVGKNNHVERAQSLLAIQKLAAKSRSMHAYDFEFSAHAAICARPHGEVLTQREASIIGGLRKESQFLFAAGGNDATASRRAIRA